MATARSRDPAGRRRTGTSMTGGSRTRAAMLLGITFLAGVAAGVAIDRQFRDPAPVEPPKQVTQDNRRDRGDRGTTIERFADELGLTEEQRAEIDPIIDETRDRMDDIFAPVRPAYRAVVDSARSRIEAILTPEQVTEYRRLLDRDYGRGPGDGRERERDEGHDRDTENR